MAAGSLVVLLRVAGRANRWPGRARRCWGPSCARPASTVGEQHAPPGVDLRTRHGGGRPPPAPDRRAGLTPVAGAGTGRGGDCLLDRVTGKLVIRRIGAPPPGTSQRRRRSGPAGGGAVAGQPAGDCSARPASTRERRGPARPTSAASSPGMAAGCWPSGALLRRGLGLGAAVTVLRDLAARAPTFAPALRVGVGGGPRRRGWRCACRAWGWAALAGSQAPDGGQPLGTAQHEA